MATGAAALAEGADKIGGTLTSGMTEAKQKYDNAYDSFYQLAIAVIGGKLGYNPAAMTGEQKITAATTLANEGISATADITDENQCTKAAAFIMQNYNDTDIATGKIIGIRTAMVSALTAALTLRILPGIGALTLTAPCAPAGAVALGAAFGAAAFGVAAFAGALLPVPSSTVTSYTLPLTVIV